MMVILASVLALGGLAQATVPYRSYTYDYWGKMIPASQAYLPAGMVSGSMLGIGEFRSPRHVFADMNDRIYIVDSGNNRVVITDDSWTVLSIISSFENNGQMDSFTNPYGIFVSKENGIYVADSENGRIVRLDHQGNLIQILGRPTSDIPGVIPDDFIYQPRKIGVDSSGRIFVIARDVYEGLMSFDGNGDFQGFIGAPPVAPSLADVFWSKVATEAQRRRRTLFLPTEFSGMDIDSRGFIHTTISSAQREDVVMRLNPAGTDILRRDGYFPPQGDIVDIDPEDEDDEEDIASLLVDVASRSFEGYTVLDGNNGKLFTYDENGNLLYAFGGKGHQLGTFQDPVAVTVTQDERILVLDRGRNVLMVFEPTEYGRSIHAAIHYYNRGQYQESTDMWRRVLSMNVNYELAYAGIGRSHFMSKDYESAMYYFRLANDRMLYSKAFRNYRREWFEEHFGYVVLIVGLILAFIIRQIRRGYSRESRLGDFKRLDDMTPASRLVDSLRYATHVILHPFDGFWDLKHENRGNTLSATVILILVNISYVAFRQYTGFIFNYRNPLTLNIYVETASVLVPVLLYCAVNWAATTLMDGKGTFRDIYITTAYGLTPIVVFFIPATILSNYLIYEEGAMFYLLMAVSVIWSLALIFTGTMIIHDYDVKKNIIISVISATGMGIAIFIALLGSSIIAQLSGFVVDVYHEITFRI